MNISELENTIQKMGITYSKSGQNLNLNLGSISNRVKISKDNITKRYVLSYGQLVISLVALMFIVLSVFYIGISQYISAGFLLAGGFGGLLSVIITEIKVTELKRQLKGSGVDV